MLDSICAPKACGGLGFRRMKDLNIALFSKLLWNIAANRNSLWIQFLKAKYLRGKKFLHDNISSSNSSWIWPDNTTCKSLITKGDVYSVNSGSHILILERPLDS